MYAQAHYSTGAVAAGFTSTVMAPETVHEAAILDETIVRYQRIKKKGRSFCLVKCYLYYKSFFSRLCEVSHKFWTIKSRVTL